MKFVLIAEKEGAPIAFFPLWEVISFVLIVTAILVVLFPHHLLRKVLAYNEPSAVSIAYLEGFAKRYPQNSQILMMLVQQQAGLGNVNEAESNFASFNRFKVAPGPEMTAQIQWTQYLILKVKKYKARNNKAKYDELFKQLQVMGKALANEPLGVEQQKTLALDNLGYHQAAVSLEIYQHLFQKNELRTPADLAEGGSIAMQNNAPRDSVIFYRAAYDRALTVKDKRIYAKDVIAVLWAGNLVPEALNFATSLPDAVLDDPDMLLYVSQLAIAANKTDIAQKFALKALLYEQSKKHE